MIQPLMQGNLASAELWKLFVRFAQAS